MKKQIFSMLLIWGLAAQALASVLVISDIDDTLKISHVRALNAEMENSLHLNNRFLGMSELFQALQDSGNVEFAYVSNAPSSVMRPLHSSFLSLNDFPEGELYLRESFFQDDFKITIIPQIIREKKPEMVLLIGDNGEQDPMILSRVQNTFPMTPVYVFIHEVYSIHSKTEPATPLRLRESGFATAVDLALQFKALGVLKEAKYEQLVQALIPKIVSEKPGQYFGDLAFPQWMDCRDFAGAGTNTSDPLLSDYQLTLQNRCKK